jgi:hypothetical protein
MIKRYNQFIKKVNEAEELEAPVKPEVKPEVQPAPAPTTTPDPRRERWRRDAPSVNPDPLASGEEGVEDNLEYLHDTLEGSQLMGNILKYKGHEITLPSETNQFEVDGVRKIKKEGNKLVPTSSAEDVIEYLENPEAQAEAQGAQSKRLQAQAQRAQGQGQAQVQGQYENFQSEDMEDEHFDDEVEDEVNRPPFDPDKDQMEFETQTGKDPEAEALAGEKVDVEKTGLRESKSYRKTRYKF